MDRERFVKLSALAFGLILLSFVLLGFGRIVLPFRTARLLAAPTTLAAAALVVYLLAWSVLAALGIRDVEFRERG